MGHIRNPYTEPLCQALLQRELPHTSAGRLLIRDYFINWQFSPSWRMGAQPATHAVARQLKDHSLVGGEIEAASKAIDQLNLSFVAGIARNYFATKIFGRDPNQKVRDLEAGWRYAQEVIQPVSEALIDEPLVQLDFLMAAIVVLGRNADRLDRNMDASQRARTDRSIKREINLIIDTMMHKHAEAHCIMALYQTAANVILSPDFRSQYKSYVDEAVRIEPRSRLANIDEVDDFYFESIFMDSNQNGRTSPPCVAFLRWKSANAEGSELLNQNISGWDALDDQYANLGRRDHDKKLQLVAINDARHNITEARTRRVEILHRHFPNPAADLV